MATSRFYGELPRDRLGHLEQQQLAQTGMLSAGNLGSLIEPDQIPGKHIDYPVLGYLWVYEPQDVDEMSLDEVHLIWEQREALCGSREVAAEVLAIIEVATGVVDTYQGWMSYLDRDEVRALVPDVEAVALTPDRDAPSPMLAPPPTPTPSVPDSEDEDELDFPPLRRLDLTELTDEELQDAWDRRPESFVSLEAACGALALLRSRAGIDAGTGWSSLMTHAEILKLADDLPDRDQEEDEPLPAKSPSIVTLRHDQRTRRQQDSVVREGQPGFRQEVLDNYYGRCCATGCREPVILEAAHISPYAGVHSNHPVNGLCLRVDIHRLFDAFLLSIEPETRQWVVAPRLAQDPTYRTLDSPPAGWRLPTSCSPSTTNASWNATLIWRRRQPPRPASRP